MTSNISQSALAKLPEPQLIEPLDFEARLAARKAQLLSLYPDVAGIIENESEPAIALLEEATYREMLLINAFNTAYRARLLYFAQGAELDHVAESYGVERLDGEDDEALRDRVRLKNRGSSSAGPDDWWRFHAMSADPLVEDVAVSRMEINGENRGLLRLSVLARNTSGVPDQDLLDRVFEAVNRKDVRNSCVTVQVAAATTQAVNVHARVIKEPAAINHNAESLEAALRAAFAAKRAMGWSVSPSWIIAQLQLEGIIAVELLSPTSIVDVDQSEALALGTVSLEVTYGA